MSKRLNEKGTVVVKVLVKSDGTAGGTVLAGEIVPGLLGGDIAWLAAFGNRAVFSADDGLRGRELWSFSPNGAPLDIRLSATAVMENQPSGTVVGNLLATDPDAGDAFTFALVAGAGDTGNSLFSISNGVLKSAAAFDFETKAARSIRVRVTDGGGLSFEKQFTVTVTDVNEAPTDITLTPAIIAENNLPGSTVGTLTAADVDAASSHTFTLVTGTGDTDNAAFNISGNQLRATASFDYETKNSYSVRVRSTDQGGMTTDAVFTISVTNVNEPPATVTLSGFAAAGLMLDMVKVGEIGRAHV